MSTHDSIFYGFIFLDIVFTIYFIKHFIYIWYTKDRSKMYLVYTYGLLSIVLDNLIKFW